MLSHDKHIEKEFHEIDKNVARLTKAIKQYGVITEGPRRTHENMQFDRQHPLPRGNSMSRQLLQNWMDFFV